MAELFNVVFHCVFENSEKLPFDRKFAEKKFLHDFRLKMKESEKKLLMSCNDSSMGSDNIPSFILKCMLKYCLKFFQKDNQLLRLAKNMEGFELFSSQKWLPVEY